MPVTASLALGAAAMWGAADFMGGLVTRRHTPLAVAFALQAVGLVLVLAVMPFVPGSPVPIDLLWGALAGICGSTGLFFLYRGLGEGQMNVIAPVTAVTAAVTPVVVGVALGDLPSALAFVGVGIAIIAVALLGMHEHGEEGQRQRLSIRHLFTALIAGLGFGGFYVLFGQADEASGAWPLLAVRVVGVLMFAVIPATWRGLRAFRRDSRGMGTMAGAGALDVAANFSYLVAIQQGSLALTPVLASLYPVSTVLLARVVLRERLGKLHIAGIALALVAIVLITVGS